MSTDEILDVDECDIVCWPIGSVLNNFSLTETFDIYVCCSFFEAALAKTYSWFSSAILSLREESS